MSFSNNNGVLDSDEKSTDVPPMGINDLCDSCGKRSLVKFWRSETHSQFTFCGHHAAKFELPLMEQGFYIAIDQRDSQS
jgi:hypothetical protein